MRLFLQTILLVTSMILTSGELLGQAVTTNKANYEVGENILATFSNGPGRRADWIGIYPQGEVPDGSPPASLWAYTNGTQTAGGNAKNGTVTFSNPTLVAGAYSVWFLRNDTFTVLAGPVNITITDPPPTDPPSWIVNQLHRRHGVSGVAYTGKVSAYTNYSNYTFSKVAGPAWLTVSSTGVLSGTPAAGDVGENTFTVRASNGSNTADVTMIIKIFAPGTEEVREIKVMSYNAWHGWGQMNNGYRKGLESIILSGADIIGMQESTDNVSGAGFYLPQKLANDLGWYYRTDISGSLGLISRYPISDQSLSAGIARGFKVKLTTSPEQEVILMNCHLDFTEYGPYAAQLSGATEASVLAEEYSSQRDEQINAISAAMGGILGTADSVPVLLTGDFNAPSHLDWVASTSGSHNGIQSVAWPTSNSVIGAGMLDSFRMIHPDPAALPGNTWSPVFKGGEAQDRIDFVYYKGSSLSPVSSEVYTTAVEATVGPWGSSITPLVNNTWPSDHAAVLTTFNVKPVDADGDGMGDAFENEHFGNITSETGSGDSDGDGVSNQLEQWLATNPNDSASQPITTMIQPTAPSTAPKVSFTLSTSALSTGIVCERSVNMVSWETVWSYKQDPMLMDSKLTTTELESGKWSLTVTDTGVNADTAPRFFYRVRSGL